MNNKQIKQGVIIAFIIYLIWVFVGLEFNPIKWDIIGRIFYTVFTIATIGLTIAIENDDKDDE
jgi:hypothetical protein